MPISVVVGGQFGSEGKGKVALAIARNTKADIVVRVGGTNSGHTAIDSNGTTWALRQLPVATLASSAIAILPPGALIDPSIFRQEVEALRLPSSRVIVSPYATVISERDKETEREGGLVARIGSTGSGTGAALIRRIGRSPDRAILASEHPLLQNYLGDTAEIMRRTLNKDGRIVIEGSQGFGLSVLHGGYYPKATSRDTTAGTFLGEAGLSPRDVDDVTLVLRCHPIRVAGDSGPLKGETSWREIAMEAGLPETYSELTTATKKTRRVGSFDPQLVKRALDANNPSRIVLNHLDYVDAGVRQNSFDAKAIAFLEKVENSINRKVDWVGTSPSRLISREDVVETGGSINLEKAIPS
jgi:adenylosuccinate synthase